jgi:hypothetical protein
MPKTTNPGHLTKLLSSAIFSAFLSDLGELTASGLKDEECNANKEWLDAIGDAVATIPTPVRGGKTILQRTREIKTLYDHWNFPEHNPEIRAETRRKLQDRVSKLAGTYGKQTAQLEKDLDTIVYQRFYASTQQLVSKLPSKLRHMRTTLARYPHL